MILKSVCQPFALAAALAAVGCSPAANPGPAKPAATSSSTSTSTGADIVKIDGSSTVFPITEAVAEEFQKAKNGSVKVTVGIKGTGGGFKRFCVGETDVSDASRPILKEEMDLARENGIEYVELPICFDALTVAVHPSNDWVDAITVDELKRIWEPSAQGTVTRWNQIRPDWPDEELTLFGAGADSGTFDYFTEAVVGKAKMSRGDFTASEDDNVLVQGIAGNKHALGYLPFAYYSQNTDKLKAVAIDWEKDELGPIEPSLENVLAGKYNPLSRPLFIYVSLKSAERPAVKEFVEFYLNNAKELSTEVHYLPLPDRGYEMGLERFAALKVGSGFGGVPEVGLAVDEIFQREPKSN
ncbi:MAG TPA: PstS family phosphate ABC transporter substrate-binding protein [Pirellulales bacterium]|nr:PstS family phosphate ABC transporter substrate-binding protein [Pirellulales bacterium]